MLLPKGEFLLLLSAGTFTHKQSPVFSISAVLVHYELFPSPFFPVFVFWLVFLNAFAKPSLAIHCAEAREK